MAVLVEAQGEMLDNIEAQVVPSYIPPHMFHHTSACRETARCPLLHYQQLLKPDA